MMASKYTGAIALAWCVTAAWRMNTSKSIRAGNSYEIQWAIDGVSKAYSMHPVKTIIDLFESKKVQARNSNAKISEEMNVIILLLASEPLSVKSLPKYWNPKDTSSSRRAVWVRP